MRKFPMSFNWFTSVFYGISIFVGYLMQKLSLLKDNSGAIAVTKWLLT